MTWQAYRLVYRAETPVHIGYSTLGFVQKTRYYIPGRAIWGAVTANVTRVYASHDGYPQVGRDVSRDMRFSYFYPALKPDNPLLPCFTENGLKYGRDLPVEKFEAMLVRSLGQTAVMAASSTAEEGSLHETEFISPVVEDNNGGWQRVLYVGYIFLRQGAKILGQDLTWDRGPQQLSDALQGVFVGGERKYGFGLLKLVDSSEVTTKDGGVTIFDSTVRITDDVAVCLTRGSAIPAHLALSSKAAMRGDIEPLVGRELAGAGSDHRFGPGQNVSQGLLCWVPGSQTIGPLDPLTLKIGDFGILTTEGMG